MPHRLAFSLAPLALLTGCVAAGSAEPGLAGSAWRLVSIDGAPAAVPDRASLRFERKTLAAHAGCNSLGGEYRIEGERLVAGPLIQTEMFCEGPVWGQEQALAALLVGAPTFALEGEGLTLASSGHRAEFARLAK